MKPAVLFIILLIAFTACNDPQNEVSQIRLKGSESMHAVFQQLKADFELVCDEHKRVAVRSGLAASEATTAETSVRC